MRPLNSTERAVLAHVLLEPDAWWEHVWAASNVDAEKALSAKVARWRPAYEQALAVEGEAYKTRAEREAL